MMQKAVEKCVLWQHLNDVKYSLPAEEFQLETPDFITATLKSLGENWTSGG